MGGGAQVDLGMDMYVGSVTVWHFYGDPRRYCNQRIALSETGRFAGEETTIYDVPGFDFAESAAGNTVQAHGIRGRYVRHWASRNNLNPGTVSRWAPLCCKHLSHLIPLFLF